MSRVAFVSTFSPAERSVKMAEIAASAGYDVDMLEWDRSKSRPRSGRVAGVSYFRLPLRAPYGSLAIVALPAFLCFEAMKLLTTNYDLVQPRNLDTLFPALIVRRLKGLKIVYDMADYYGDSYASGVPILRSLARLIEAALVRRSDAIVLSGPGQILQVGASNLPSISAVFYNIPMEVEVVSPLRDHHELTLIYVGTLIADRRRTLLNVAEAITGLPIQLSIGGYGQYQRLFSGLAANSAQIKFLGKLTHKQTMESTNDCDFVVLPFDPRIKNYRVGISTKFLESISLAKPVVAPLGTLMGEIVDEEKIGTTADFTSVRRLRETLKQILGYSREEVRAMGQRARALYISKFNPDKVRKEYLELIGRVLQTE